MHNRTWYNSLSERVAFMKQVGDSTHIREPIAFHNRTEYNALSMRATVTKQVRGFAQPPAHVLCDRTEHNPHTELAACTKRGMTSHNRRPMCYATERGTVHIQSRRPSQSKPVISHSCQPMCYAMEQGTTHIQSWQHTQSKAAISHIHRPTRHFELGCECE